VAVELELLPYEGPSSLASVQARWEDAYVLATGLAPEAGMAEAATAILLDRLEGHAPPLPASSSGLARLPPDLARFRL
jgi:hypothetical protein